MNKEIILERKPVGNIKGNFYIPSYQRGYRWSKEEVCRLLSDIAVNGANEYYLQPVVVKRLSDADIQEKALESGEWFEVIDGQQRLTTLYLIYLYMFTKSGGFFFKKPEFSLVYETREESASFLKKIDFSLRENNIDYWFICGAYEAIQMWFETREDSQTVMIDIYKSLGDRVKVIWYEVDESENAISLFKRLNIGKIPLTSAELVKALFLCNDSYKIMKVEKQEEISFQWDSIEKELQNDSLWYFLSNTSKATYQTRIDLVLDLIAHKKATEKDAYYTFFYFDNLRTKKDLDEIWLDIQQTFLTLKDWYENHELYHKIGFLIASESVSLQELYDISQEKTKNGFRSSLDELIRKSIRIDANYADLSYEKTIEKDRISKLLLLFNVESVRQNGEQTQWFPFDKYKYQKTGKVVWSLEHIHAQQSEGLKTEDTWREWLEYHIPSLEALGSSDCESTLSEIHNLLGKAKISGPEFNELQTKVVQLLSAQGNTEYMHTIANLALLNTSDNAALNNSTFDVKRNEIIKMDKAGQYIPFCTKMVFLKYYTPSAQNQVHFWGFPDRNAYVKQINEVLKDYLSEAIHIETEKE